LGVAEKPDSHDICFIPDGDTAGFLRRTIGAAPGEIIDATTDEVLGSHDGAYAFTVGQRKGLKLGRPAADGKPRYVLDISPVENTVRVGPAEALDVDEVIGIRPVWTNQPRTEPFECVAQLRAHGQTFPATTEPGPDRWIVRLHDAARGVAAGQAVVLYDGDAVIGSATITSATRAPVPTGMSQ
jgi:tRNA-specific 2-thiouridylase